MDNLQFTFYQYREIIKNPSSMNLMELKHQLMFRHLTNQIVENCKVQIYPVIELILILPIFTDKITGMKKLIVSQLHFITVKKKRRNLQTTITKTCQEMALIISNSNTLILNKMQISIYLHGV